MIKYALLLSVFFGKYRDEIKIAGTGFMVMFGYESSAQVNNGGNVVNVGFMFPSVARLSDVPTPIPIGLQVACTCDSMLHFWDGTEWHINLDSGRVARLGYIKATTAAATYQLLGTYATASNAMAFTNKTGSNNQWTNDAGYITGITSGNVTTALGFTPYNATNPSGYIASSALAPYKLITDSGRCNTCYATGYDVKKVGDSVGALIPSVTGLVTTTRTINTTSPLTGGGDLSANRTFAINNGAADNTTKGAVTLDSNYFNDNGSGLISFAPTSGTGSVSANAVTINQPKGKITYASPSIVAAGTIGVTFTNSFISSTSIINIGLNGNGSNLTGVNCYVKSQTSGSCVINIQNLSLLSLFNTGFIIDFLIVN